MAWIENPVSFIEISRLIFEYAVSAMDNSTFRESM